MRGDVVGGLQDFLCVGVVAPVQFDHAKGALAKLHPRQNLGPWDRTPKYGCMHVTLSHDGCVAAIFDTCSTAGAAEIIVQVKMPDLRAERCARVDEIKAKHCCREEGMPKIKTGPHTRVIDGSKLRGQCAWIGTIDDTLCV